MKSFRAGSANGVINLQPVLRMTFSTAVHRTWGWSLLRAGLEPGPQTSNDWKGGNAVKLIRQAKSRKRSPNQGTDHVFHS